MYCMSLMLKPHVQERTLLNISIGGDSLGPTACQAPLSMVFSRQEYWSVLPCPSPWDLPNPGIKPRSPTLWANSLLSEPPGKPSIGSNDLFLLSVFFLVS